MRLIIKYRKIRKFHVNLSSGTQNFAYNGSETTSEYKGIFYIHVTVLHRNRFLFNNQPDALIIQIYSVIELYMLRLSTLPVIRSFMLYIRHW
jgi:hypothetical protein